MEGCDIKYKYKTHFINHVRKIHGRSLLSKKENSNLNIFLQIQNLNRLFINTLNELDDTDKDEFPDLHDSKKKMLNDISEMISDHSNKSLRKVKRLFELYFCKPYN